MSDLTSAEWDEDNEYDDCCQCCGGEGFVFECFDGCCEDYMVGCDQCTEPCPECGTPEMRQASDGLRQVLADALDGQSTRTEEAK